MYMEKHVDSKLYSKEGTASLTTCVRKDNSGYVYSVHIIIPIAMSTQLHCSVCVCVHACASTSFCSILLVAVYTSC